VDRQPRTTNTARNLAPLQLFPELLSLFSTTPPYIVPQYAADDLSPLLRNHLMSFDPANPYSSPPSAGGMQPPPAPVTGMDYMRMITYVFDNPNWFMNLLLAALCSLIPVIGKIVVMGYLYEATITLMTAGGSRYPDFNFSRFGDYLMRGLWPFLVSLVFVLALLVVVGVALLGAGAVGAAIGEDAGKALSGFVILIIAIISPVLALFLLPMLFRSALTLEFAEGFNVEWAKSFIAKVWLEMLLGFLFLYVASMVLGTVGLLACCVGIFLVGPVLSLAYANLMFQLYSIFLSRGGAPVPIRMVAQTTLNSPM